MASSARPAANRLLPRRLSSGSQRRRGRDRHIAGLRRGPRLDRLREPISPAGDTRTPLVARTTGFFGFFLCFSYLAAVVLGFGVVGIYAGIVLAYAWMTAVVGYGFLWGDWDTRAAAMMEERRRAAGQD